MKMLKRTLALMLALIMMFSAVPFNAYATESTDEPGTSAETPVDAPETEEPVVEDEVVEEPAEVEEVVEAPQSRAVPASNTVAYKYNVVHLDAGRKYFSVDEIKTIIDNIDAAGFNQLNLYLSDNQGFRFALDDMTITTSNGTYDLTPALGDGYSADSKYPCGTGKHLTQSEMDTIITYAHSKGIDIVPAINVPGHMGAILEEFPSFRYKSDYSTSKSSIDLANDEAVAFALALTKKYATYFASKGCKYYCVGADEYANDLSRMGFEGMGPILYTKFVQFLNDAADIVIDLGMTPRAFNDGFYYKDYNISIEPNKAYEVYYWSSGWGGYDVAAASTISAKGHKMINTHGDYYWVLGKSDWQCSASKARGFSTTAFQGSTVSDPAGAMFCIWCDVGNADSAANVISKTASVIAAFGRALPEVEDLVSGTVTPEPEPEVPEDVGLPDAATGIVVTAPGLTDLTVKEATAPTIEGAKAVVAYNIELATDAGAYVGAATVSIPVPETWTNVLGGVMASANGAQVLGIEGTLKDGFFTFLAPHFSDVIAYDATKSATVTVSVNGTATVTVKDVDYSSSVDNSELNTSIANVDVKYEQVAGDSVTTLGNQITINNNSGWSDEGVIKSGDYYLVMSNAGALSATTDVDDATIFTITRSSSGYYTIKVKDGNYYLSYSNSTVTSTTSTYNWRYSSNYGFYRNDNTRYLYYSNGSWSTARSSNIDDFTHLYDVNTTTTDPTNQTTITFTGKAVGTTYVTVGDTRYTINVVAEDLSKVDPLVIETWITNHALQTTGTTKKSGTNNENKSYDYFSKEIKASAAGIYSKEGVTIASLVDATCSDSNGDYVYWQSRYLTETRQDTSAGNNQTAAGSSLVKIRYWKNSETGKVEWQYQTDAGVWTSTGDVNGGSLPQVIAYYLQKTNVTDEVATLVVDHGIVPHTDYDSSNFILIDYAVKYESGELTPSSFPVTNKTQSFHCDPNDKNTVHQYNNGSSSTWSNYYRDIGMIYANETSEYEIYMITVKPSSDRRTTQVSSNANTATRYTYSGTEKVVWVDDEANLGKFSDESLRYTTISGKELYSVGGDPIVPGLEIFNRHGMLVTYYVRAKATEDALTVHYVDDTEKLEFYHYNIAVKEGTTFNAGIALNTSNPNGNLQNGTVTNYHGKTQTVSADLSTLSQVGAQYLYSDYTCVRVERRDAKNVYLYYTFDPTVSFVVDFGLPMTITAADLSEKLENVTIKDMYFSETGTTLYTQYGKLTDNNTTVTYAPNKVLGGTDHFTLVVKTESAVGGILDDAATTIAFRVYVVPATTVYYEEGFLNYTGSWAGKATMPTIKQTTEVLGKHTYHYGYDPVYADDSTGSNDTKVSTSTNGDSASFTFTGTGFELYANCNEGTGYVTVTSDGQVKKMYMVDTGLNYEKLDVDMPGATATPKGYFYNIPIISEKNLPHGTYTVTIRKTHKDGQNFEIDGFRVTNTIDESNKTNADSIYKKDLEDKPEFYQLRDMALNAIGINGADAQQVYNDISGAKAIVTIAGVPYTDTTAQDLLNNGPKNELYLFSGQTLTFNVKTARKMQIGLKAPNGATDYAVTCTGTNGFRGTMNSSVDMFYELGNTRGTEKTYTVSVKNTGKNVLAVTDLKICDDPNAAFAPLTLADIEAIMGVNETPEEPEVPETPVEPEVPEETTKPSKPQKPSKPEKPGKPENTKPTEPEVEETTKPSKPGKPENTKPTEPQKPGKPGNNGNQKPGKPGKEEKTYTLKITFVNLFGKKVGTATITTTNGVVSAYEIIKAAPKGRTAIWLIPVTLKANGNTSIVVPVL